jgi:hypothetical protein
MCLGTSASPGCMSHYNVRGPGVDGHWLMLGSTVVSATPPPAATKMTRIARASGENAARRARGGSPGLRSFSSPVACNAGVKELCALHSWQRVAGLLLNLQQQVQGIRCACLMKQTPSAPPRHPQSPPPRPGRILRRPCLREHTYTKTQR